MNTKAQRIIKRTWKVQLKKNSDIHSAGLVLPSGNWEEFDPFLVMAEDIFQKDAFDFHPHRGMETVTYVIDGVLEHSDNKGGSGILNPGDAQWMTAGSGIMHLEAPPENVTVHTLQLWVNLPKANKMAPPRYQDILSSNIPVRKEEGVNYRVFSGNSDDVVSTTKNYAPVTMVEIVIDSGHTASQDFPSDYNGFIYILEGSGMFGDNEVKAGKGEVLLLESVKEKADTSEIIIKADEKLRVIFIAGKPLNETVVARGPFVMNTEEEIKQAYADFRNGKF
jgi:redox-sensitive bicupin YhaK (pirin superfamily)